MTPKQKRVIVATVRPIKTFDNWKFSNNNSRKRKKIKGNSKRVTPGI